MAIDFNKRSPIPEEDKILNGLDSESAELKFIRFE